MTAICPYNPRESTEKYLEQMELELVIKHLYKNQQLPQILAKN